MEDFKRKVWRVSPKAGSFDRLSQQEESITSPQKGEVLIEVKAIGLNFADIFAIFGLYSATPKGSFIPGLEFSGVVKEVGPEVSDLEVGQRVMGVSRFGAYTSHLISKKEYVIPIPEDWSFDEGAAYLVQVLTAYYGLVILGNLQPKQNVLIHSAAGGVGIWANRIVKHFDGYTIGSIGSPKKVDFLKSEGYDDYIVRSDNFGEDLKSKLTDRDLHIVMECIGGKVLMDSYKCLTMEGRLITYGSANFATPGSKPNKLKLIMKYLKRPKIDPMKMIQSNKGVFGFNLIYLFEHAHKMEEYLGKLEGMNLGKPIVGHTFEFSEMRKALELFLSGSTTGKVVIQVN